MGFSMNISFILALNTLLVLAAADRSNRGHPYNPNMQPPVSVNAFYNCVTAYIWWNKSVTSPDQFFSATVDKANFTAVLNSTAQNYRLLEDTVSKPDIIFRVVADFQIQPTVWCAQRLDLNLRVRSGGHDYEGLSYASFMNNQQFMILDLFNLRNIDIDTQTKTAWVQAGATIGELYYWISRASPTLAFPAGLCTTLGFGGHVTGGGYGSMMRKFGLAADNVLDVQMIDAFGMFRNRELMGEDLFWALRGGGGGNFGVIMAWKIKLVTIPRKVTMFTSVIPREAEGAAILQNWLEVAPGLDPNLFIRVTMLATPVIPPKGATTKTTKTVICMYQSLYLGSPNKLVRLMQENLPKLGVLNVRNVTEMSWIESVMNFAGYQTGTSPKFLLKRKPAFPLLYMKAKSDFLREVMSVKAIEGMWDIFMEQPPPSLIIFNLYGGKMSQIQDDDTPFPHRNGVIVKIQYVATWNDDTQKTQMKMEDWMRRLYDYMRPLVSKNPRESYVNYRDLDIGKDGTGSNCSFPTIWGPKYFKDNFPMLVEVKRKYDPFNFFYSEQSIPLYWNPEQCTEVM